MSLPYGAKFVKHDAKSQKKTKPDHAREITLGDKPAWIQVNDAEATDLLDSKLGD